MRFLSSIVLLVAALSAVCQPTISIAEPTTGQTIQAGENFTVTLTQTNYITGGFEVAIAIGYTPCDNGSCPAPSVDNGLGIVKLVSPYTPQYDESWTPPNHQGDYQNFTFSFPASTTGQVQIEAAHWYLLSGSFPTIDFANVTVNVV